MPAEFKHDDIADLLGVFCMARRHALVSLRHAAHYFFFKFFF